MSSKHPTFNISIPVLVIAVIFTLLVGGLSGLLALLIVLGLLYSVGGGDSETKHGISEDYSCRLGGVILVVYPVCVLLFQAFSGAALEFSQTGLLLAAMSLGIFALGLYEDLTSVLSARRRLVLMLLGSAVLVFAVPDVVVQPLGLPVLDSALQQPLFALPFTMLALAFLPNAFNVADGANGLLSGVCLFALYGLMELMPDLHVWPIEVLFTGCLIFFVLNVLTGKLFLGDGGAYLLGLTVGVSLILVANQTEVSPWFLAMLIFYPMTDFLFSMIRRVLAGRSPMAADNDHFHNLVYVTFKNIGLRSKLANTLTGVCVASLWSGSAVLMQIKFAADISWPVVYFVSWCIFLFLWIGMKQLSLQRTQG